MRNVSLPPVVSLFTNVGNAWESLLAATDGWMGTNRDEIAPFCILFLFFFLFLSYWSVPNFLKYPRRNGLSSSAVVPLGVSFSRLS